MLKVERIFIQGLNSLSWRILTSQWCLLQLNKTESWSTPFKGVESFVTRLNLNDIKSIPWQQKANKGQFWRSALQIYTLAVTRDYDRQSEKSFQTCSTILVYLAIWFNGMSTMLRPSSVQPNNTELFHPETSQLCCVKDTRLLLKKLKERCIDQLRNYINFQILHINQFMTNPLDSAGLDHLRS